MTEDSITRRLSNALSTTLRRFVRQINDDLGTGTEVPAIPVSSLDKGWTYPAHETVRERYERGSV